MPERKLRTWDVPDLLECAIREMLPQGWRFVQSGYPGIVWQAGEFPVYARKGSTMFRGVFTLKELGRLRGPGPIVDLIRRRFIWPIWFCEEVQI